MSFMKKLIQFICRFFVLLLIIIILFILFLGFQKNERGFVEIQNKELVPIIDNSMKGTLDYGDLVIVQEVYPEKLKDRDIITYYSSKDKKYYTKRISRIEQQGSINSQIYVNGDNDDKSKETMIDKKDIVGYCFDRKVSYLGNFLYKVLSIQGFITYLLLPLFGFILILVIISFLGKRKESNLEKEEQASSKEKDVSLNSNPVTEDKKLSLNNNTVKTDKGESREQPVINKYFSSTPVNQENVSNTIDKITDDNAEVSQTEISNSTPDSKKEILSSSSEEKKDDSNSIEVL